MLVSILSPFAACTVGGLSGDTNFVNAEVEPFVAVNPRDRRNVIGVYQQDRWSGGGSHGLVTAYSNDGGTTWGHSYPAFSTCVGGTPANGGAYDRSSDPWVSIGPDGRAYQVSLSVSADELTSAILASTSTDGGAHWSDPSTVISQTTPLSFNDKESVTADPSKAGTAYVVWDRSGFPSDSATLTALEHSFAFRGIDDRWWPDLVCAAADVEPEYSFDRQPDRGRARRNADRGVPLWKGVWPGSAQRVSHRDHALNRRRQSLVAANGGFEQSRHRRRRSE